MNSKMAQPWIGRAYQKLCKSVFLKFLKLFAFLQRTHQVPLEKITETDILSVLLTCLHNLTLFVIDTPKTIFISQKFSQDLS